LAILPFFLTPVCSREYHLFMMGGIDSGVNGRKDHAAQKAGARAPAKTLIIIPAYNEADSLGALIRDLKEEGQADILVVNDGSTDRTEGCLLESGVPSVSLPINLGIGGAVQTGFRYALEKHYDIAVQVDGDGQHDPLYIEDLVRPIFQDQADVVIGSRFVRKTGFQSSYHRRVGIRFLQFLSRLLTGQAITDSTSGFRAYNSRAIAFLADKYAVDFPEPEAVIAMLKRGFRIREVPVEMRGRGAGTSSISGWKSVYYLYKVVISMVIEAFRSPHD
jgi:glycosyltransferase involved in cell wall biosynthesis